MKKGFSTLEIMIAMSLMVVILTAVIMVSFGNQMSVAASEANAEALKRAQGLIEREQALARKDFNLVNATTSIDGFFTDIVEVELMPGFMTKEVKVRIEWKSERNITQHVELTTVVTDFNDTLNGSTCNSSLTGNWSEPDVETYSLSAGDLLPGGMTGSYPVTDVDAYFGKLYVTVSPTSANTDKTFFVFDISDQTEKPVYLGGTDNAGSTRNGLNAVKIANNEAFLANAHDANFNSCSAGPSCSQLQIINVEGVSETWNPTIVSYKLATSTGPQVQSSGGSGQAVGKSIFHKEGYVYLGLSKTGNGPEMNIIDVRNPIAPFWVGSWPTPGISSLQPINNLSIRGGYAYLVHPTDSSNSINEQLTVVSVTDPQNPARVSGFYGGNNEGNGKSLVLVGDLLYLGRTITTFSSNPEFNILDISNPTSLPATAEGGFEINNSANDLLVRDYLTFLLTNNRLEILKTDNASNITPYATAITLPGGSSGRAIDCEGNHLYVGSASGDTEGFISVITGS